MSDDPPVLMKPALGALLPANGTATDIVQALTGVVEIKIVKSRANLGRMRLYWSMLDVAAENLEERFGIVPLDAKMLHRLLKHKLKLGREVVLPSGEIWLDTDSISFSKMDESERSAWIDRCSRTLSKWLGCEIHELMSAANREAA